MPYQAILDTDAYNRFKLICSCDAGKTRMCGPVDVLRIRVGRVMVMVMG